MERLTKRNEIGLASLNLKCPEGCEYVTSSFEEGYQCQHQCEGDIIEKLAEYEDLEEQGLLMRLPCRVGDTIYVIPSITNYRLTKLNGHSENNRVYEQIVHSVRMFSNDRYAIITCEGHASVINDFYKETWFLTREEAEQKLKEIEDK